MDEKAKRLVRTVWETKNKINDPSEEVRLDNIFDSISSLFSAGISYYFLFAWGTYKMQKVSKNIKEILGIDPGDFSLQYALDNLYPEDLEKFHEKENVGFDFLINFLKPEDLPYYKVVYLLRIKALSGGYKMILQQSRTVNVSNDGKVQQILCIHSDITNLDIPMDHTISFIGDGDRPSYYSVPTKPPYTFNENCDSLKFSKREKEIIKEMAKGETSGEIGAKLHISPHTVKTHRKNIYKKTNSHSMPELITNCIRNGII